MTTKKINVIKIDRGCSFHIFSVIDTKNKLIVPGFIRESQNLFPYNTNTFYIIPHGISLLCAQYFGHHLIRYYGAGYNGRGQCGIEVSGAIIHQLTPIMFDDKTPNIHKLCVGLHGWNIIWIRNDGQIYVNGKNYNNQLGFSTNGGDQRKPKLLTDFTEKIGKLKCIDAVTSYLFCMVLCDDGSVWSSGLDGDGEMGFGGETKQDEFTKIVALKGHKIIQIKAAEYYSLFVEENGNVWSCGNNNHGRLGVKNQNTNFPARIPYFEQNKIRIIQVECGGNFGVALSDDGNVYCWGGNGVGQCGIDNTESQILPTRIDMLDKEFVIDIKAGGSHTGCHTRNGNWYLWGCNCNNECVKVGTHVRQPFCVNNKVIEVTQCQRIVDMTLGDCNTYFIVA